MSYGNEQRRLQKIWQVSCSLKYNNDNNANNNNIYCNNNKNNNNNIFCRISPQTKFRCSQCMKNYCMPWFFELHICTK